MQGQLRATSKLLKQFFVSHSVNPRNTRSTPKKLNTNATRTSSAEIFASSVCFAGRCYKRMPRRVFHQHLALGGVLSGSGAGPSFRTTDARRQEMQSGKLLGARRMNIAEEQHVFESILAPSLITALPLNVLGFLNVPKS